MACSTASRRSSTAHSRASPRAIAPRRTLIRDARRVWHEHGASWRTTALAWVSVAVLGTASTYIPVFGAVRDESFRRGYKPLPWIVPLSLVGAIVWMQRVALGAHVYSLGARWDAGRWTSGRRAGNAMMLIGGPLLLVSNLVGWLLQ